jgi:hypothetical protein
MRSPNEMGGAYYSVEWINDNLEACRRLDWILKRC